MRRWLSRPLLLLAAMLGGGVAPASAPLAEAPWTADPEAQYLLDVQVRGLVLGDGVRAYPSPSGTCLIFGDLLTTLDLPARIDLKARVAEGWAFREEQSFRIDRSAGRADIAGQALKLEPEAIRDTPEGWCVETAAAARWLGIKLNARTESALLLIDSEAKLPVELAAERRERAARLTRASFDITSLPKVRLPYRMWRAPSVDVMVDAGLTYSAKSGRQVDHRASILAAGELFQLSYEARAGTDRRGLLTNLRLRAFRSDPEGSLLGPLKATHVGVGDVEGIASPVASSPGTGRGAVVTNRPLFQSVAFDRTQFSGELPAGWDAELYRNGELVAFASSNADGRYRFDEVSLRYGENRFEIISYGPQGQVRSRVETIQVGPQAVPPGESWYWAGIVDPGRDLLDLRKGRPPPTGEEGLRAAASIEHGLDQRTSVAALVQTLVVDDERVTYVEGAVRRAIGPALVEVGVARDTAGGTALRGQALARIGATNFSWSSFLSRDFSARPEGMEAAAEHRFSVDGQLKLRKDTALPLRGDLRMATRAGGGRTLEASGRTSLMLSRFNLAALLRWRETRPPGGGGTRRETEAGLIGSGRIGPVRLRGSTEWEITPRARFRSAELTGTWSRGGLSDWEGALAYEGNGSRVRGRVTHIRRFDQLSLAGSVEAASDGSVAAGLNLAFSVGQSTSGWRASRETLAGSGGVRARVFRDDNRNGMLDSAEKVEEGALITAGQRPAERPTGRDGWTSLAGLETYRPVAIGVDITSLSDPHLVPSRPAQMVVPRPGISAEVLIPLVGGGAIEGTLLKDGGGGFDGMDLELVDETGRVVGTVKTDFDGFFLFERVPAGRFSLRLSAASLAAAKTSNPVVRENIVLREDQAVVRLGSLTVRAETELAVNHKVVSGDLGLAP